MQDGQRVLPSLSVQPSSSYSNNEGVSRGLILAAMSICHKLIHSNTINCESNLST